MYSRCIFSPALDCSLSNLLEDEHPPLILIELKPNYLLSEICDGAKQTDSYKNILDNIDEIHLNSSELCNKMISCFKIKGTIMCNKFSNTNDNYSVVDIELIRACNELKMTKISTQIVCNALFDSVILKHSYEKICMKYQIGVSEFKTIERVYRKIIKILKIMHKNNQRNKLRDYLVEIEFIKQYMVRNFVKNITLKRIQNKMKLNNEFIKTPSTTTISKLLKTKLYYSYKKSTSLRVITNLEEAIKRYKNSVAIQFHLQNSNLETIYIDEFSL